jgi:hypothetical protein
LKRTDEICFGALNATPWVLINDNGPKSMLVPIKSAEPALELEGVVVLPNEKKPEMTLYQEENGEWLCENNSGITPLESGSKISTANNSWYFINADTLDETKKADQNNHKINAKIKINFTVSRNEEHVSLGILFEDEPIDLGERTHHYLLLVLARKRLKDVQLGIDKNEQGWLDKNLLCQQVGFDENHLNIQIYRFRKQLIQARPAAMQLLQIIERRRGELRFGLESVEITGGFDSIKKNKPSD